MSRRAARVVLAVALALVSGARAAAEDAPRAHLKVAVVPYLSYAPLFIAAAEGFFAEEGLEVEFVEVRRTSYGVAGLVQGDIDVLPGHVGPAYLNAIARGADIRFVADKGHDGTQCVHHEILVRRELIESGRVNDPASLRGLRLAGERGQPSHYYLSRVLARGGLTMADVTLIDLPPAARLDAFAKGQLDAAHESEPWLTLILRAGDTVAWREAEMTVPDFQAAVVLFGPRLLRREPEVGERFLIAYLRAVRQLNLGKTERNVAVLAERTRLDPEIVLAVCWPQIRGDGSIGVESVLEYQTWALADGLIDRIVKPEEFWDPRFAERAVRALEDSARGGP